VNRWLAALPLAALALLAALFAGYALRHDPHVNPSAMVGQPLPDLTLPPLQGGAPLRLRAVASPATLINFYASWCAPCEQEHPALLALRAEGVRIVGVAYKDKPENTKAMLARLGDPFTETLVDADGRAGLEFGVSGVPETFLVGPDGRILAKHTGPLTPDTAEALLETAKSGR
jgi:cytochrome c biogenesis protein CcmG/thiol:disulfide interchange protein DsbE